MPERSTLARAVLVIDDDPVLRRLVTTTLRGGAFGVLQAATALDGLRLARDERPTLVFLDIGLGNEDGVRLCRALKSDPDTSAIHVVMLSGRDDPATRVRAQQAGADAFFAKPFSPLALWRVVDALLSE